MSNSPFLCLVWALTDPPPGIGNIPGFPVDPGFGRPGGGGHPSQPIHHPGHPDHGLPSQPGHPSQPIFHPGHPDHGLPAQPGHPSHPISGGGTRPDQGLPGGGSSGARPDQGLPDGEDVEIDNELPPIPPEYADKTIVAIKRPDQEWIIKAYDPAQVDNTLPQTPEPK